MRVGRGTVIRADIQAMTYPPPAHSSVYFGDYSAGWIKSIDMKTWDPASVVTVSTNVYPCEIKATPFGLVFVDHAPGFVTTIAGAAPPPPPPEGGGIVPGGGGAGGQGTDPNAPLITVTAVSTGWAPGDTDLVTASAKSAVEGREGFTWLWSVQLLFNCGTMSDDCDVYIVAEDWLGPATFGLSPPDGLGTLEFTVIASTFGGYTTKSEPTRIPATGTAECVCSGVRTLVQSLAADTTAPESLTGAGVDSIKPFFI